MPLVGADVPPECSYIALAENSSHLFQLFVYSYPLHVDVRLVTARTSSSLFAVVSLVPRMISGTQLVLILKVSEK